MILCGLNMSAFVNEGQLYDMQGTVDNKYNVTVYLVRNDATMPVDGSNVSGKMFYHSTIAKHGVKPSSYLYINGVYNDATETFKANVYDSEGNYVESWTGEWTGGNRGTSLECKIIKPGHRSMTLSVEEYW